jgi:thiol-disulfide isomerase/thioredoxin
MNTKILHLFSLIFIIICGCTQKSEKPEPNYFMNLNTGEIFEPTEYSEFRNNLHLSNIDSTKGKTHITWHYSEVITSNDSIIQPFKYTIRIGNEYIVRAHNYEKIGMKISPQKFITIDGDSIQIGGEQQKPILINLWFIGCRGCVAETPALNNIYDKYIEKVDFVAITFNSEKQVKNYLGKQEFKFNHLADASSFINQIGTKPYPENIFIDKKGIIRFIEGGLSDNKVSYFEYNLESLLN